MESELLCGTASERATLVTYNRFWAWRDVRLQPQATRNMDKAVLRARQQLFSLLQLLRIISQSLI